MKQFSSELIVEAVVRCVRVIDPGLGGALPTSLPPGMSARFRVGMSLAQACQVRPTSVRMQGVPSSLQSLFSEHPKSTYYTRLFCSFQPHLMVFSVDVVGSGDRDAPALGRIQMCL